MYTIVYSAKILQNRQIARCLPAAHFPALGCLSTYDERKYEIDFLVFLETLINEDPYSESGGSGLLTCSWITLDAIGRTNTVMWQPFSVYTQGKVVNYG